MHILDTGLRTSKRHKEDLRHMYTGKKTLLAAGLLAAAAAMTGCTAGVAPVTTPSPQAQKATAQPATGQSAQQDEQNSAAEQAQKTLELTVDEKAVSPGAVREEAELLLPLMETAQALGWEAKSEETEQEDKTQTRRVITLDKDESRITVSWTVSDNTARNIVWQKDGLLIPVDTRITTIDDAVYVPAAFFEEAMGAAVSAGEESVSVMPPEAAATPDTQEQRPDGNG